MTPSTRRVRGEARERAGDGCLERRPTVASAPGVARKSATIELRPAPNSSVESRRRPSADSDVGSVQPPDTSASVDAWAARAAAGEREDDGEEGDRAAEAIDERAPAARTASGWPLGRWSAASAA